MASTLTVDNIVGATTASTVHAPGHVIQVVSVVNGTTESTSNSSSFVAHSGLVAAITPKFSNSKILVTLAFSYRTSNGTNNSNFTLYRGSTNLLHSTKGTGTLFSGSSYYQGHQTISFLDSPNTTSSTSYQLRMMGNTTTSVNTDGGHGTITLQEIAQ
jgi:hypothetical protein